MNNVVPMHQSKSRDGVSKNKLLRLQLVEQSMRLLTTELIEVAAGLEDEIVSLVAKIEDLSSAGASPNWVNNARPILATLHEQRGKLASLRQSRRELKM